MPSYGSLHSPSINKINGGMDSKLRRSNGSRVISFSNILGDPFALATLSIALLAWSISLIGSIIATAQGLNPDFPNYSWFALAYTISCIIGVFIVVASDTIQTYHIAIVGFLSCGLVLTTSSTNSLIYSTIGAKQAVAAGHILLSMINIIWIFYFGSTPSATPRAYLDSFALHKDRRASQSISAGFSGMGVGIREIGGGSITENRTSVGGLGNDYGKLRQDNSNSSSTLPQMYTSSQLADFKSASTPGNTQGMRSTIDQTSSQQGLGSTAPMSSGNLGTVSQMSIEPNAAGLSIPTEYPYRAKAIYSYEANPEDANEISFSKHEVLDVSDVSGRWWQARKENGETGIAPSNYLILL